MDYRNVGISHVALCFQYGHSRTNDKCIIYTESCHLQIDPNNVPILFVDYKVTHTYTNVRKLQGRFCFQMVVRLALNQKKAGKYLFC